MHNVWNRFSFETQLGLSLWLLLTLFTNARADVLRLRLDNPSGNTPICVIQHVAGASEGLDGFDSPNIPESGSDRIGIYSQSYSSLAWNALPAASFTVVTNVVEGINLSAPVHVSFRTTIFTVAGEFTGKVLNLDIYSMSNGIPVFLGTYDARTTTNGNSVPLTITNGHSHNIVFRPTVPNIPPVAQNQTNTVPAETTSPLSLYGYDADAGSALHFAIVTGPTNGALQNLVSNAVTYQSAMNYYGSDGFVYSVDDGQATNYGTVSLNITPVSRQPYFSTTSATEGQLHLTAMAQPNRELRLLATDSVGGSWLALQTQAVAWSTNLLIPVTNTLPATNVMRLFRLQSVTT